jgi:hypothetical protein
MKESLVNRILKILFTCRVAESSTENRYKTTERLKIHQKTVKFRALVSLPLQIRQQLGVFAIKMMQSYCSNACFVYIFANIRHRRNW